MADLSNIPNDELAFTFRCLLDAFNHFTVDFFFFFLLYLQVILNFSRNKCLKLHYVGLSWVRLAGTEYNIHKYAGISA